ncbi:MAG: GIY-YIG nuclease family protein [Dehalobacter sp. 4CP]|uniref:GIY-YIG nuclease family protein n=1 Tax=Dehalobacter sp. CP TaxID=2594474 RepID=UPI0013C803EE|nr:GIY-YIG nuclease family protein [Dehalobacter sp. 4CP]
MAGTSDRKRELRNEYKERKTSGGAFMITNNENGRYVLQGAVNIRRFQNRFDFSKDTGSCVLTKLQQEWNEYGAKAFKFEILEEIEMKDTQTMKEFEEDLQLLEEIWAEKLDPKLRIP